MIIERVPNLKIRVKVRYTAAVGVTFGIVASALIIIMTLFKLGKKDRSAYIYKK